MLIENDRQEKDFGALYGKDWSIMEMGIDGYPYNQKDGNIYYI